MEIEEVQAIASIVVCKHRLVEVLNFHTPIGSFRGSFQDNECDIKFVSRIQGFRLMTLKNHARSTHLRYTPSSTAADTLRS